MTDPALRWRAAALAAASLLPLWAPRGPQPTLEDLLKRIEEQDQKILVLERKLEIKEEADKAAASTAAVAKASDQWVRDPVGRRPEPGQAARRAARGRPLHAGRRHRR